MGPFVSTAALLLLLGAAEHGQAVQMSVQEIVKSRLMAGFKEGCDPQATAMRDLSIAVRTAYGGLRMRQGKGTEAIEQLLMDVKETAGEDNSSFSKRVMAFRVHSPSETEDQGIVSPSKHAREDRRCLVTRTHLKRVGVSVMSLDECPLMTADMDVAISAFKSDDCISFVERDFAVSLFPTFEGPPPPEVYSRQSPGSPGALAYWLEVTGVDRAWTKQSCARDVVVGVIDTGVAVNHPDLKANLWHNEYEIPGNGIDDDRNGYIDDINGYDFYQKTSEVSDAHGHGTHCAGIIGSTPTSNSVQGVCKTVSIAGLRFMDAQGSGATSDAIEAINYAIEMDFHITSNSWGGPGTSAALLQSIQRAAEIDQLFVAAAGNSGNNADNLPEYPAAYKVDNIISVAATDEADRLANFSNYGKRTVHVAAPGVFIVSTFPPATVKSLSGTSMATPVVSGISAMLLSVRPMPVSELRQLVFSTADRPRTLKNKVISDGRIDAAYALCVASNTGGTTRSTLLRRLKKQLPPQAGHC
ncbi:hypothetical protein ACSSS7_000105 [Eimeria intestinalis]